MGCAAKWSCQGLPGGLQQQLWHPKEKEEDDEIWQFDAFQVGNDDEEDEKPSAEVLLSSDNLRNVPRLSTLSTFPPAPMTCIDI